MHKLYISALRPCLQVALWISAFFRSFKVLSFFAFSPLPPPLIIFGIRFDDSPAYIPPQDNAIASIDPTFNNGTIDVPLQRDPRDPNKRPGT